MNKIVMFFWGLIILAIWFVILVIAYKKQDRDYIKLTNSIQKASLAYIEKNNIELKLNESIKIYMTDLYKDDFLVKDEKIDKYCIDSIVVSKDIINYDYQINKECKE